MVKVPAKDSSFQMGDTLSYSEKPVHTVSFTYDFWMDTTEVTQFEYDSIMQVTYSGFSTPSRNVSYGVGDDYPAYYVNWYDAVLFCNARTKATGSNDTVYTYTGITGTPGNDCELSGLSIDMNKSGFRLPTEAEWEYSCRGGTTTSYYWNKDYDPYPETQNDSNEIDDYVLWVRNSSGTTGVVAQKMKNAFNLYDITGNVWEWCNDWFQIDYYAISPVEDPTGPTTGTHRAIPL